MSLLTEPQHIEEMQSKLTKIVIDAYEPESSRWNRNYSDRAEWYFLWFIETKIEFIKESS